jgi:ABC-type transport system involved in multi-copper enzyme maturation permease subunit
MFIVIWLKEIKAELCTWKSMLWLVIASLLFSLTSYLLLTDKELSLLDHTELLWLLGKIIVGTAFLIVTIDASSIITSEFEKQTAESLFLSPLRLKDFILGKLMASLTLWLSIFVVATPYILATSSGTHLTPAFLGYVALLGTLGIIPIIMLIFAISFLFRSVKSTLSTSLVVLLVFSIPALFSSTLKNNALAQIYARIDPVDNIFASLDNVLVDYQLSLVQNWQFIWPLIIFCAVACLFMFIAATRFQRQGLVGSDW